MATTTRITRAIGRRIRRVGKVLTGLLAGSGSELPDIVMIMGCQRSGTTMLLDVFDRDLRARVFRDVGALTNTGGRRSICLNPLPQVEATFRATRAPLVVAKPLADSHRAREILSRFNAARIIWMYRDYRDVAVSDLRRFGEPNGLRNLAPMLEGDPENWRSAGVSDEVRSVLRRFHSPTMKPHDAAALFWWARNALYFEQGLHDEERALLLRYEGFVRDPVAGIRDVYAWLSRPFPGPGLVKDVHTQAIGKARDVDISHEIAKLCTSMQRRLDGAAGSVRSVSA